MGTVWLAGIRNKNCTSHGIHALGYAGRSILSRGSVMIMAAPPKILVFSIDPALEA